MTDPVVKQPATMKTPPMLIEKDEALMSKIVQRHSQEALERLYRRYAALLKGVVMRIMNDEFEAEEVLQDVFVHVWNHGGAYSAGKGRVLGWLIIITRRRTLDRLRQRSAYQRAMQRLETTSRAPVYGFAGDGGNQDEICIGDMRRYLSDLIRRLPSNQEQVVELTFFEGLTQREISMSLHIPLGTVKTRIELGLRKLTESLRGVREKVA